MTTAMALAAISDRRTTRTAISRRRAPSLTELFGDEGLCRDRQGVEHQCEEQKHRHGDLVGGEGRIVDAGGDRRGAREHRQHRANAQQQVATGGQQRRHLDPAGPAMAGWSQLAANHEQKGEACSGLGDRRRPGGRGDPQVETEHEYQFDHQVGDVRRHQDHQRRPVIGRAALHSLGGEGDQHEGHTNGGDTQVLDCELEHRAVGSERRCQGSGAEHQCGHGDNRHDPREPHGLDADLSSVGGAARIRAGSRPARWCRR